MTKKEFNDMTPGTLVRNTITKSLYSFNGKEHDFIFVNYLLNSAEKDVVDILVNESVLLSQFKVIF